MTLPTLLTPNLRLRPLDADDAETFHDIFSDSETMRYMPTGPVATLAEVQLVLMSALSPAARYWAVELNDGSDEVIGYVGFLGDTTIPGMGYLIARRHWRKGYGREACLAVMDYGFEAAQLAQIELWIHEDNVASLALAKQLGFRRKGRTMMKWSSQNKPHLMVVFGMWDWEWRKRNAPQDRTKTLGMQVVLGVYDVVKSAEYYRDKLGFRIEFLYGDPPTHAAVSRNDWTGDGVTIQLTQYPAERPLNLSGHLYIFAESVKRLHKLYREAGVDIVDKPETKAWGMMEFTIRDCNGYIIVFGTHAN